MSIAKGLISSWSVESSVWTIILALFASWLYYRVTNKRFLELAATLPGPLELPLIGHAYIPVFIRDSAGAIFNRMLQIYDEFKDFGLIKIWLGPRLLVGIWSPEAVEAVLSSNIHLTKSSEYDCFKPWLGDGLLISSGEKWRSHRKLIAPTFHLSVLKTFISVFNENSRETVKRMEKDIGKVFDAHDYMVETTVEILLETAMGVNKKTHENAFDYGKAVMKMCDIIHYRHVRVWFRSNLLFGFTNYAKLQKKLINSIHSLTTKVIQEKQLQKKSRKEYSVSEEKNFEKDIVSSRNEISSFGKHADIKDDIDDDAGEKKRVPFLDQLIDISQEGVLLSETEIKEQVDTIMFEGHDTTAAAASFFMCVMGYHTEHQDMCAQELKEIFGDSDRPATFQDTLEMKYLERCILETLRMFPPVPVIGRILEEDLELGNGLVVPKGATVGVIPYAVHRYEKIYPNPDVYNPDNFLPENIASRHPYSFVPFSSGPRSCVGRKYAMLKLKILLSTILRNYRCISDIPPDQYRLQADVILKRADGFKVQIEPRRMKKSV